jgi:dihydroorotate dehydrogenase (NAD+) catalytic subunit
MSDIDLSVDLGGVRMKNPVAVASGTFGYGKEYAELIDVTRLGAVTVKGIRLHPWPGNRLPRHVEVTGGMVNAIGLQGPGVEGFVKDYMPFLRGTGVPVIVNVWGTSEEEYAEVARRLGDVEGVSGLELNISCPNVKEGGHAFGTDPRTVASLVAAVRRATRLPLMPKLAPNVPDIKVFVRAAQEAGADALALINTLPAMVIDIETRRPVLANTVGGLSGPAIHPVAVKLVWEAAQAARVPLLAMGGITGPEQAVEFLVAGAAAVAVGTANFIDPTTPLRVIDGIEAYLRRHGMRSVRELTGSIET